ncbi:MAG: cytochrome c [Planctomycetota bacterium]|nr:MAG: cytochrome c [Planctomycetota bacterium]
MGLMKGRVIVLAGCLMFGPLSWAVADEVAEQPAAGAVEAPDAAHGRMIFENICSHCHNASHETSAVGAPGLMDVIERHDEAWLDRWLSGPEAFAANDEDAKALVESNPYGLVMPTLPEMQDPKNRRDVIAFLKTLRSK